MLAPWLKSGIAAVALSGMAATGMAFQDQLEWAKSKLMSAPSADPKSVTALSAAITEWRSLRQTNNAPFESYARFMLAHLCAQPLIDKHRHEEMHGGARWQIDVFHGANDGLVIAEIELESVASTVELPAWAGAEVSGDSRYYNSNLLAHPYSEWFRK